MAAAYENQDTFIQGKCNTYFSMNACETTKLNRFLCKNIYFIKYGEYGLKKYIWKQLKLNFNNWTIKIL